MANADRLRIDSALVGEVALPLASGQKLGQQGQCL